MVVQLISKIVKPKGHEVANFEKTVAQVSFIHILSIHSNQFRRLSIHVDSNMVVNFCHVNRLSQI